MFKRKSAAACGIVLALALAVAVHAWDSSPQATLTFSKPVSLPNVTLAAGTYVFELADPDSSRRIVRVGGKRITGTCTFLGSPTGSRVLPDCPMIAWSSWGNRRQARRGRSSRGFHAVGRRATSSSIVDSALHSEPGEASLAGHESPGYRQSPAATNPAQ
jgi:hypothetical protein